MDFLKNNHEIANALAAVGSASVAIMAFIISVISLYVTIRALKRQHQHNVLSVKPIPEITVADYENSLRVKIRNNGPGPLIIKKLHVGKKNDSRNSVIEWMPTLPNGRLWNHFSTDLVDRSLLTGKSLPLLELTANNEECNFAVCRDMTRKALCSLVVNVSYTDIYGTNFQIYSKELSWFGRTL